MRLSDMRCLFPAVINTWSRCCGLRVERSGLRLSVFLPCRRWLSSTAAVAAQTSNVKEQNAHEHISENDVINKDFINRNPRNLEFMGIARKRKGWKFQYPSPQYYHRVVFEPSVRHTSARVEHSSGKTVVAATTKEVAIARHLYRSSDTAAAVNIGRVLAQRCRECGITSMTLHEPDPTGNSRKFVVFKEALEAGGISLTEPEEVQPMYVPGISYDNEEDMEELKRRQRRVAALGRWTKMYLQMKLHQRGKRFRKKVT